MPDKQCSIESCDRKAVSRGWCSKHYMRWRKYGDPEKTVRPYGNQPDRCSVKDCAYQFCNGPERHSLDPDKNKVGETCPTKVTNESGDLVRCSGTIGKVAPGKAVSRGFCAKHYTRFRKHGDAEVVLTRGNVATDPKERFESKYTVDPETGCWEWTGAANGNGWATISIDGRAMMAHRFAYETYIGPIPKNANISRTCSNPRCVNPKHLFVLSADPVKRFQASIRVQPNGCWRWKPSGFVYRVKGKPQSPRAFAYERANGGVPNEPLYALCGNSRCVNPEHSGTARERYWSKVEKADDGCWYWRGAKLPTGYPHLTWEGKSVYAHRLSYEWAGGVLEEDHVLVHTLDCGHKDCVNPEHLEQVTYQEMVNRRESRRTKSA